MVESCLITKVVIREFTALLKMHKLSSEGIRALSTLQSLKLTFVRR